jgi:hypothetical protein
MTGDGDCYEVESGGAGGGKSGKVDSDFELDSGKRRIIESLVKKAKSHEANEDLRKNLIKNIDKYENFGSAMEIEIPDGEIPNFKGNAGTEGNRRPNSKLLLTALDRQMTPSDANDGKSRTKSEGKKKNLVVYDQEFNCKPSGNHQDRKLKLKLDAGSPKNPEDQDSNLPVYSVTHREPLFSVSTKFEDEEKFIDPNTGTPEQERPGQDASDLPKSQ